MKKLQTPTRCTDPQLAADELRAWERWKKRAETLGLLTPDPTILVKGLASITSKILEKAVNREIAFRTSLVRSVLQVDSKPTMDTVMQFHGHLLGEMEQLASTAPRKGVANQTSNPNANNNQEPQVKGLQANQPNYAASKAEAEKARKASTPCRFFGKKDSRCPKSKNCVFKRDWSGIPDKPPRCKSCAGLGHFAQDCPNSKRDNPKGKGKSRGKGDGKGKDNSAGANAQGGNSVTNKTIVIEEVPQSQSASSSSGTPQPTIVVQTTTPPTTTPDLKTLIADLSSALKSEAKIHMKALEVEIPEEAKNVGTANPSFEDGQGGLERPNGEDATILLNDGPNGQLSQQIASEKEKRPQVAQTPVCTLTTLGLGQKRPAGVLFPFRAIRHPNTRTPKPSRRWRSVRPKSGPGKHPKSGSRARQPKGCASR